MNPEPIQLAVIGGGPAGLRAAECAARRGVRVTVFEAKPSVGRKFLVAGKGGLNLTHGEDLETFITRYQGPGQPHDFWHQAIHQFSPAHARAWALELGVETFQARTGRVYPTAMKAAPLLRRWISTLRELGVRFAPNHCLTHLTPGQPIGISFENATSYHADAVILATGGGSWPQTGSDGSWLTIMHRLGIQCSPLVSANSGWECQWPPITLQQGEGKPLKNITASAAGHHVSGELMITRHGLEGGAIYQLGPYLRAMDHPAIIIDLKPTFTLEQLLTKMESVRHGFLTAAATRWKLSQAATAILSATEWQDARSLAQAVKQCTIPLIRPRPIAEAISSAGGICWSEIDSTLMLRAILGCFVAGEMIDWEAPTGGYLIQGCLATGTLAGNAASDWLRA